MIFGQIDKSVFKTSEVHRMVAPRDQLPPPHPPPPPHTHNTVHTVAVLAVGSIDDSADRILL